MTSSIVGAVDNFQSFNVFGGWAHSAGRGESAELKILAYYDGMLVGQSKTDLYRVDLGQECGFLIRLDRDVEVEDIISGKFIIRAVDVGDIEKTLNFIESMVNNFSLRCLGKKISQKSDYQITELLSGLASSQRPLVKAVSEAVMRFQTAGHSTFLRGIESSELSMFGFRVGLKSPDGTSVVGRNGNMFILAGTNQLIDQYAQSESDQKVIDAAASWLDLFRSRQTKLARMSVRFIQTIIPEKSSVVPELFPLKIQTPTALLRVITQRVEYDPKISDHYVDSTRLISGDKRREDVFRKVDSHLSSYGARLLIAEILGKAGAVAPGDAIFTRRSIAPADLGSKFTGSDLYEEVFLPEEHEYQAYEQGLRRVEIHAPPNKGHIGTRVIWSNDTAPNKLTVVAFGNSFFERGGSAGSLSWWCARYFTNFHFIWSPDIDFEYIKNVKPDLVICQTIERFLSRVASS